MARARPKDLLPVKGPLIIVAGSPGSGKTTFAAAIVGKSNVLDLDVIKSELSGAPIHMLGSEWTAPALCLRNHILRRASRFDFHQPFAMVIGAPTASERAQWTVMLRPRATVVMETPADEAFRRIRSDPLRQHCWTAHEALVTRWWEAYSRSTDDVAVKPSDLADDAKRNAVRSIILQKIAKN